LLGILVLVQLNWSSTSWAWTLEGHRLIALDALAVLPPPMREALTPHVSILLAGAVEPDFHRVVSHKIQIISLRGTPPPPRSRAADAFQRFATNAEAILHLGRDLNDVSFVLGQATHFVQDLNQPLHAALGRDPRRA
jgi:zinc dependent phospholipase C